jgi:hypothetical protein
LGLVIVAAIVAFLFAAWLSRSRWSKGELGEIRVSRALHRSLNSTDYRLFDDIILPIRDGTTQIDHIVVSRFGVFVIETKNMMGWIFGSADQPRWTQVAFRRKSQFQNPIRQNLGQVRAVQALLRLEPSKVHGIVAFVGTAIPKTQMPFGVVWGVRSLADHIKSRTDVVLSDVEVRAFVERLSDKSFMSNVLAREDHIRNVKARAAKALASCPRCGAALVERSNRQSGHRFLACSTYPRCKGTRQLL